MISRIVALVCFVVVLVSCTPSLLQAQSLAADRLARAVNDATPILHDQEKQDGFDAVKKASTRDAAEAGLQSVEEKWRPVWNAIDALAAAHDAWAIAIKSGGVPGIELLTAACDLKFIVGIVAPAVAEKIPTIPGFTCPDEAQK